MSDINIPGVGDKYKTNDLVNKLLELEKGPLNREKAKLDSYKLEKESWQRVNKFMASTRDSARGLYSYNNPFNEKNTESSDDSVLTAEASRDAEKGEYKVYVDQVASADKFLSNNIDKDFYVNPGKYTYTVGDRTLSFNYKGGTLGDFTETLNKRGKDILKASIINVANSTRVWSIESIKTGADNVLDFDDDALSMAAGIGIIQLSRNNNEIAFGKTSRDLSAIPHLDSNGVAIKSGNIVVPPQNGVSVAIPENVTQNKDNIISLKVRLTPTKDITDTGDEEEAEDKPFFADAPKIEIGEFAISNFNLNPDIEIDAPKEKPQKIENYTVVYARNKNGTETALAQLNYISEVTEFYIKLTEYPEIKNLVFKNYNTGKTVSVSDIKAYDSQDERSSIPLNPVSLAADAKVRYEGVRITRSENKIDDVIPNITLNLENASSRPVIITVDSDEETAKNSIIEFVGNYNRLIAEMNILTGTNENIVSELEYFTEEEAEEARKRLGLFQADFTLTSGKQALQSSMVQPYLIEDNETIRMLSQIGISSKATAGGGITSSQMRGYLEIDEKKLDEALANNMSEIKNLFGYDADNDMVIDSGLAYVIDQRLNSYTQTGGILTNKTSMLDSRIENSNKQVKKLEDQLKDKEQELREKYSKMEGTLNSLESQSSTINNFNKQNSK